MLFVQQEQRQKTDEATENEAQNASQDAAEQFGWAEVVLHGQPGQRGLARRIREHIQQVVGDGQQALAFPAFQNGVTHTGSDDPGLRGPHRQTPLPHLDRSRDGGGQKTENAGLADRSHLGRAGNGLIGGLWRCRKGAANASTEEKVFVVEGLEQPLVIERGGGCEFQFQPLDAHEAQSSSLAPGHEVERWQVQSRGGDHDDRLPNGIHLAVTGHFHPHIDDLEQPVSVNSENKISGTASLPGLVLVSVLLGPVEIFVLRTVHRSFLE